MVFAGISWSVDVTAADGGFPESVGRAGINPDGSPVLEISGILVWAGGYRLGGRPAAEASAGGEMLGRPADARIGPDAAPAVPDMERVRRALARYGGTAGKQE